METRASYFLIGLFTLIVIGLALVFALWIGKASLDREFDEYDIVFTEAVTGVNVRGVVQYSGIQVGAVRKLSLDPSDPRKVIAHVRVDAGTPVKVDTRAKLTITGLTGVTIIQLTGGSPDAPRLTARDGAPWPTIIADDSALQNLLTSSEDIATGVSELLVRVSVLLRQENLDKFDAMIDHVETLTSNLAARSDNIGLALDDIAAASRALKSTMQRSDSVVAKLDRIASRTEAVLTDAPGGLVASSRAAIDHVGSAGEELRRLLETNRESIDRFTGEDMAQVGPAIVDLRTVMNRLQRVLERLDDNPPAYLLGRQRIREVDPP
jgi:phospholipid/cholesterol/gamma-HCH transport system substrate-binding protein